MKATVEAGVRRLAARPEKDDDKERGSLVRLAAHRAAAADQPAHYHRLQTSGKHPCDLASSPYQHPHSA